ncbi:hypothetical protein [Elongatibacter sediminis]|uniref:Uncharacterized protein n=1 Tax=Elongatibacter sediminis TaxID=3119006 RepID=A0AAW9RBJ1_9GAMM
MKMHEDDRYWREKLGGLPRRLEPPRDPWERIEARISARSPQSGERQRRRAYWPLAAAAVAVAAIGVALLGGRDTPTVALPDESPPVLAGVGYGVPVQAPGRASAMQGTEREYRAALREFRGTLESASSGSPIGVYLDRGWFALSKAEGELATALRRHPDDPYINERLVQLRTRQVEMLRQMASADLASRRQTI